jgi:uncharacterized protein (DUF1810 family)
MAGAKGGDPHDPGRFVQAQEGGYGRGALRGPGGRKRSHWVWYVSPQYEGLGFSPTSRRYAIKSIAEAEAYLAHAARGPRLTGCAEAALGVEGRPARRQEVEALCDVARPRRAARLGVRATPQRVFRRRTRRKGPSPDRCRAKGHVGTGRWRGWRIGPGVEARGAVGRTTACRMG